MWGLLLSTLFTGAVDSLNPIAITQQFVLQGMVKKPRHIWFFIIPTGVVNLIGGFLAYYGLLAFIDAFLNGIVEKYRRGLLTAELILGVAFLVAVGLLIQNTRLSVLRKELQALKSGGDSADDEADVASRIKSVSPIGLVLLGVGATISELTTALPYFAFLAILLNYQLTLPQVSFILVVYNLIYMSPLMILYFIYIRAQDKFDRLYHIIKTQVAKAADILAPILVGLIGVALMYHSLSMLLK